MSKRLQEIVSQQKIPYFCHFTHIFNAKNIMTQGIVSVDLLNERKTPYFRNDDRRYDGYTSHNCLSIGFPNDKLFYQFRKSTGCGQWVVFLIKPSILWETDSRFCITNSARAYGKYIGKRPDYFERLFKDNSRSLPRSTSQLLPYMPTDVQAEILIPNVIHQEYLLGCVVINEDVAKALPPARAEFYISSPSFFSTREEFIQQSIKKNQERK